MAPATTQDLSAVAPIKGPQVWNGQDFAKSDNFSVLLDGKDVEEIEAAVKEIKGEHNIYCLLSLQARASCDSFLM